MAPVGQRADVSDDDSQHVDGRHPFVHRHEDWFRSMLRRLRAQKHFLRRIDNEPDLTLAQVVAELDERPMRLALPDGEQRNHHNEHSAQEKQRNRAMPKLSVVEQRQMSRLELNSQHGNRDRMINELMNEMDDSIMHVYTIVKHLCEVYDRMVEVQASLHGMLARPDARSTSARPRSRACDRVTSTSRPGSLQRTPDRVASTNRSVSHTRDRVASTSRSDSLKRTPDRGTPTSRPGSRAPIRLSRPRLL